MVQKEKVIVELGFAGKLMPSDLSPVCDLVEGAGKKKVRHTIVEGSELLSSGELGFARQTREVHN